MPRVPHTGAATHGAKSPYVDTASHDLAAQRVYDATIADGGTTLDATLSPVHSGGWAVGGNGPVRILPIGERMPIRFGDALYAAIERGAPYIGTWTEEGSVYIDGVDIIPERADAIRLGTERGEIAIYNLDTQETVRL